MTDENNGWVTADEIEDDEWSQIKCYLIDFDGYILENGEKVTFYYYVAIPENVSYNDVTYCTFATYFSLVTEYGKYATQTETSKLGIRIEKKFNLEIQKYKEGSTVSVEGAKFSIQAESEEESDTATTDSSGALTLNGLYVEKVYTLTETKAASGFESSDLEIKFMVSVLEEDSELGSERRHNT